MTDIQEQIVIGAVLGGSSLYKQKKGKNYFLSMRSKDKIWLWYKIAELESYFSSSKLVKQNSTFRCASTCDEDFTHLHKFLYDSNKRVVNEVILDKLNSTGLMTWWLEAGGWAGRGRRNAYLNTTLLGEEATELVQRYFEKCYIDCNVNKNKNRRRILFSIEGTAKLWKTIAYRFPPFYIDRIEKASLQTSHKEA